MLGWRLGDAKLFVEDQVEAGIVLNLIPRDAGIEGQNLHQARGFVERKYRKLGDDTEHSTFRQAALGAGLAAADEARAGNEIHMVDEATLLVLHRDNHVGQAGNVVATAGAGKPGFWMIGVADERGVQIAVLVDLRATHETDVDITAL